VSDLQARYQSLLAAGELRPDPDQASAVEKLARLETALAGQSTRPGLLLRLLGARAERPKGIYCGAVSDAANRC
jgi:cell division protein ZapE